MPLASFGWEGETEANNREPEDLPGNQIFPSRGAGDPTKEPCMSSTPIVRNTDSRSHDLTTISMLDSLLVCGLLCAVIWSLITVTILAT